MDWDMDSLVMGARQRGVPIEEVPGYLPLKVSTFDVLARLYFHSYVRPAQRGRLLWAREEDQILVAAYRGGLSTTQIHDNGILHRSLCAIRRRLRHVLKYTWSDPNRINDTRTTANRCQVLGPSASGIELGGTQEGSLTKHALPDQWQIFEPQDNVPATRSTLQRRSGVGISSDTDDGSSTKTTVRSNFLAEQDDRAQDIEQEIRAPSGTSQYQAYIMGALEIRIAGVHKIC